MPKRNSSSNKKRTRQVEVEITECEDYYDVSVIPDDDNSGESDCSSESENDSESECKIDLGFLKSFRTVRDSYTDSQKKLEENHIYDWVDGEIKYNETLENETLLTYCDRKKILESSLTQIFEFTLSLEVKKHIIECTKSYGYELSLDDLNKFIGVIVFSCFNKRLSQRDYWSKDEFLRAEPVASCMSVKKFENIKSKLKLHKPDEENKEDRIWRVRSFINVIKKNVLQFGFFSTALSVDEMMLKYYGRCSLKQFIKSKPIRFGIKMWGVASSNGYLFDFDIYCGKNAKRDILSKTSLGSRVVIQTMNQFLTVTTPRKIQNYHLYFDNLFCSVDLLVHLKKFGLRCTGTIRQDRIPLQHNIDKKKDERGTFHAMYDKNSGINYITVMDSKPVSILSTAAGVNPTAPVERFDKTEKMRKKLDFPRAFSVYNKYMGGLDVHDQHCNKVLPIIRSKKWTWVIFVRCIQMAITNATVLFNTASANKNKKIGTKDLAMAVARSYLNEDKSNSKLHEVEQSLSQKCCSNKKCSLRTRKFCKTCNLYFCKNCFHSAHSKE